MKKIILASRSKRRKSVLDDAGIKCTVIAAQVDESIEENLSPEEVALLLAIKKGNYVFEKNQDDIVIGVMTVIVVDNHILGKPKNDEDAKEMLRILSGKTHLVTTACYLVSRDKNYHFITKTEVDFGKMTEDEIEYYVNTGEVFDKSGAYTIKGFGSRYVKGIRGDFYNVLGLPIYELYHELKKFF